MKSEQDQTRRQLALVAALASDVPLLLLDEPTSGLDPLMEEVFQQVVHERRAEGTTVLLSSHLLGEVEALADRVSIIRAGRTVTTGTLTELRRHTHSAVRAVTVRAPALAGLVGIEDVQTSTDEEGRTELHASAQPDAVVVDGDLGDRVVAGSHQASRHAQTRPPLDREWLPVIGAMRGVHAREPRPAAQPREQEEDEAEPERGRDHEHEAQGEAHRADGSGVG